MSRKKKIVTAASTFSVALGIGFVMQYGDAVASRSQPDKVSATPSVAAPEFVVPQDVNAASTFVIPEVSLPRAEVENVQLAALSGELDDVEAPRGPGAQRPTQP